MRTDTTCEVLNRLWMILQYSLPSYLHFAPPAWEDDDGTALQVLQDVQRDQRQLADRLGAMILERGGEMASGAYPRRFTAMHDLSATFVWQALVVYQERTVEAVERFVDQLPEGSEPRRLGEECLGAAKAHLDSFREISAARHGTSA